LFPTRLLNFARLPREERRLAVRALGWLVIVRAGLALLPFTRVRSFTSGVARGTAEPPEELPRLVRRAVLRASRSLPRSSCLAQSLVAERLLLQAGCEARLSIGVAPSIASRGAPRRSIDAHAWVKSGGLLVTGDDPHERYELLATFGPE
jgi:hypothetical protein